MLTSRDDLLIGRNDKMFLPQRNHVNLFTFQHTYLKILSENVFDCLCSLAVARTATFWCILHWTETIDTKATNSRKHSLDFIYIIFQHAVRQVFLFPVSCWIRDMKYEKHIYQIILFKNSSNEFNKNFSGTSSHSRRDLIHAQSKYNKTNSLMNKRLCTIRNDVSISC